MKTILVGDLHLTAQIVLPMVEEKLRLLECQQLVLLGDYTDAYNQTKNSKLYLEELDYLLAFKRSLEAKGIKVVMLLGNHDSDYVISNPRIYSLQDTKTFMEISKRLLRLELQVAYELGDYLVSHAGYTEDYQLEAWHLEKITNKSIKNVAWISKHIGISRGGTYISGSPLWADFEELTKYPNRDYRKQIVGHTPQKQINLIQNPNSEIVGIDTFTIIPISEKPYYEQIGSGEILLYDNDKLEVVLLDWKNETIMEKINSKFTTRG